MLGGILLFFAQYLQVIQKFTPIQTGLWTIPAAIAMTVGCILTPRIARRFRIESAIGFGFVVVSIGCLILTQINSNSVVVMGIVAMIIFNLGLAYNGSLRKRCTTHSGWYCIGVK